MAPYAPRPLSSGPPDAKPITKPEVTKPITTQPGINSGNVNTPKKIITVTKETGINPPVTISSKTVEPSKKTSPTNNQNENTNVNIGKPEIKEEKMRSVIKIEMIQPKIKTGSSMVWTEKDIVLKGAIKSDAGLHEFLVNGEEFLPSETNNFSYNLKLGYRDNLVRIKAIDKKGNSASDSFLIERKVKQAASGVPNARTGTDYALIIATDEYKELGHLSNPVNDGTSIAKELQERYNFKVKLIKNPDRTEFYGAIREFNKSQFADDDQLFIFIAGHGIYDEVFSEGYIVARDSKKMDEVKESYISHSNLRSYINNIPCKHILLVMDVCFGGTFDNKGSHRGEGDESEEKDDRNTFIHKKLQYTTRKYITSGGKEYVPDGRPGYHSPFAYQVLEALRSSGKADKILTFSELNHFTEQIDKKYPIPRGGEFGDNKPGSDFLFIAK